MKQLWFSSCWGVHRENFRFSDVVSCFLGLLDAAVVSKEVPNFDEVIVFALVCLEKATSAGIARNDQGEVIAAYDECQDCTHPLVVETSAILAALKLPLSKKWDTVIIESGCKLAVDSILKLNERFDPSFTTTSYGFCAFLPEEQTLLLITWWLGLLIRIPLDCYTFLLYRLVFGKRRHKFFCLCFGDLVGVLLGSFEPLVSVFRFV
ncbi:hypothetical protein TorRG33x02_317630 [Trema orientale]|uniref:RNase H type-1 domain-containing protein n=1 Tax=Trema orientale TaxID=63057 RepID=A0A2P5BKX3_TREOI|nr:hypothetical protein TorRG33x02_317630 [Trema orientale]